MKELLKNILLIYSFVFIPAIAFASEDQCLKCHSELDDEASKKFLDDVHYKVGLSCKDCHGGNSSYDDMDMAMSKKNGFIGVPKLNDISALCAKCHSNKELIQKYNPSLSTNQFEELKLSIHGSLSTSGKEMILQCTTCHNHHGIKKVSDPKSPVYPVNVPNTCSKCHNNAIYMQSYNPSLTVDQLSKYRTSKHGKLNSAGNDKAAECASCHGSHFILSSKDVRSKTYKLNIPQTCSNCHSNKEYMKKFKIATNQYQQYRSSAHGVAVFENNDLSAPVCNDCHGNHGAAPPGIESISKVCGICHVINAQLFSESKHKKVFDANKYPECETCHGKHDIQKVTDNLLGVDENAVCSKCHNEKENTKGFYIAKKMKTIIERLKKQNRIAKNKVYLAEQKGMDMDETKYKLRDINQSLLESRTIIHSFDESKFKASTDKGILSSKQVIAEANNAIDEFYFRRYGLLVSTIIISMLALLTFLYIKRIENNK